MKIHRISLVTLMLACNVAKSAQEATGTAGSSGDERAVTDHMER
jgi:hypothetical protein